MAILNVITCEKNTEWFKMMKEHQHTTFYNQGWALVMLHSVGEHARWVESSNLVGALRELSLSEIKCLVGLLKIWERYW